MPYSLSALVVFASLAAVGLGAAGLTQEEAEKISARPGMTWRAGIPEHLQGKSKEQLRAMLMPLENSQPAPPPSGLPPPGGMPDYFNAYEKWPRCRPEVYDQGSCGACWAFGALETLADRLCIAKWDLEPKRYSEADLVSCDMKNLGCHGGWVDRVWATLHQQGYVDYDCQPYTLGETPIAPRCSQKCVDGSEKQRSRTPGPGRNYAQSAEHIQEAVTRSGPVEVTFDVYTDFYYYLDGVYQHTYGELEGRHAVEGVGYGLERDLPYWNVRNSWGPGWGEEGFFRIVRGRNECRIEAEAFAEEFA